MVVSATVLDWIYHAARWTWHDADGYNFISGPLADITLLGAGYALLRHHNCHVRGCWRIGRQQVEGTSYVVCHRHHPHGNATVEQVHAAHNEFKRWAHAVVAAQGGPGAGSPPDAPTETSGS